MLVKNSQLNSVHCNSARPRVCFHWVQFLQHKHQTCWAWISSGDRFTLVTGFFLPKIERLVTTENETTGLAFSLHANREKLYPAFSQPPPSPPTAPHTKKKRRRRRKKEEEEVGVGLGVSLVQKNNTRQRCIYLWFFCLFCFLIRGFDWSDSLCMVVHKTCAGGGGGGGKGVLCKTTHGTDVHTYKSVASDEVTE